MVYKLQQTTKAMIKNPIAVSSINSTIRLHWYVDNVVSNFKFAVVNKLWQDDDRHGYMNKRYILEESGIGHFYYNTF